MKSFNFMLQYVSKPRTVGAILPSSKHLSDKMIENIDFQTAECIVEYGPGTGIFTENILARRNQSTVVLLLEQNKEFYELIKDKYSREKNFIVINDSAERIVDYLEKYRIPKVDYVISGLPFASLPQEVTETILVNTLKILKTEGEFIAFQYTKVKRKLFQHYFSKINVQKEYRNIPPAYIFYCRDSSSYSDV